MPLPFLLTRNRLLMPAVLVALAAPAAAEAADVLGGAGPDRLRGSNSASNVIEGDGGGDTLYGGPFGDRLLGDAGGDRIFGKGGDDYGDGGSGDDVLDGGAGHDEMYGGFGRDNMLGGDGADRLDAGSAGDRLNGGSGDDLLHGGPAEDHITGGDGNDEIHSDSGPDHIFAGPGDDTVYVNNGTVVKDVDCGDGHDVLHINPQGQPGFIMNRRAIQEGRIKPNCEVILQTAPTVDPTKGVKLMADSKRGEVLLGGHLRDSLLGGPGPDTIRGEAGNDVIWGNLFPTGPSFGTDTISAGADDDQVFGGRGANKIWGGAGNDFLQGGPYRNTIYGEAGNDSIRTRGSGPNYIFAGKGDDIVVAYAKGRGTIDCGPGRDEVRINWNKVLLTRHCEVVRKAYVEKSNKR